MSIEYNLKIGYEGTRSVHLKERKIWDKDSQILSADELEEGKIYQPMHEDKKMAEFKLLKKLEGGWIEAEIGKHKEKRSLRDIGVASYEDGWNPTNWLKKFEE